MRTNFVIKNDVNLRGTSIWLKTNNPILLKRKKYIFAKIYQFMIKFVKYFPRTFFVFN